MKLFQKLINLLKKSGIDASKIDLNGQVINLTSEQIQIMSDNFSVDTEGKVTCSDINITGGKFRLPERGNFFIGNEAGAQVGIDPGSISIWGYFDSSIHITADQYGTNEIFLAQAYQDTSIQPSGIVTPQVTQTSKAEYKKNFEKLDKGLDIIKNIDIYKYNLKSEEDKDKKHIGFVIGDKYKYSKEITSKDNKGVDIYSFVSVCCKAIQEQQEQIEKLQNQIKELGGNK